MNYHDLLGVGPDAGPEEIRAAWSSRIADVDPSDWRFAAYNEALTELLKERPEEPQEPPREVVDDEVRAGLDRAERGAGDAAVSASPAVGDTEDAASSPA